MIIIDWEVVKDIISIIATVSVIVIGIVGLTTWRRQLRGTSEYELAKKAILSAYQIQQAIQSVRDPLLYLSTEEVEAGRRLEEEQRIYDNRMKLLFSKWAELQAIRLECKVIWSSDGHDCFDGIRKCIGELKAAIWLHFWMKGSYAGPGAEVDSSPDRRMNNDKIVYFLSDNDDFSTKISTAIKEIEEFFTPKVRSK
jgi:hypothetical protein